MQFTGRQFLRWEPFVQNLKNRGHVLVNKTAGPQFTTFNQEMGSRTPLLSVAHLRLTACLTVFCDGAEPADCSCKDFWLEWTTDFFF